MTTLLATPATICNNVNQHPGRMGWPVFLPCPYLLRRFGNQPDWPKDDWQAFVVCNVCGQIDVRTKRDVRWEFVPEDKDTESNLSNTFQKVLLKCDQKDCESRIEVLMLVGKNSTAESKIADLKPGSNSVRCSLGHPLSNPVVFSSSREIENED